MNLILLVVLFVKQMYTLLLITSDLIILFVCQKSDDEGPIQFKRTKTLEETTISKNKYMLCDEDTDDENDQYKVTSEDEYDGVWININDLPEPFYPLKEYKPRYIIPDEDIIEDSPTGCLIIHYYKHICNFNLFKNV